MVESLPPGGAGCVRWQTVEEFLAELDSARLYGMCGGPYPADARIRPVSRDEAIALLEPVVFDPFARVEFDVRLAAAAGAARPRGWWDRLWWRLGHESAETRRIRRRIGGAVDNHRMPGGGELDTYACIVVSQLLEVVAALLRAERLHDFPMIALAGRVGLGACRRNLPLAGGYNGGT